VSLTKDDLNRNISKDCGFPITKSLGITESMLEIMKKTLESGEDVLISGFGKFCVKEKNSGQGRNPQTGRSLTLDARRVVVFRCSPLLKEKLNGKGT
jgi:integration host factor subunit alpha